jgi:hypothetical protein
MESEVKSSYYPPDFASMLREWKDGAEVGEKSYVSELDDVFAWKTGLIQAWYGWANDGKGTFFDFMATMKSKFDDHWKWCFFKQEDMSSSVFEGRVKMNANDIYNNLVWVYSGKTPYKHFAKRHGIPQITINEYQEVLEWVENHFFVVYPKDRRYKTVMDEFKFYHEKFGIKGYLIDPFKSLILDEKARTDFMMNEVFIEAKEFALQTNTNFNFIAHPKSMTDVKMGNKEDSPYKVVNQFMIAGGAAWDNNMDAQFSIYRPERHLNPSDPKVHFHNLKQRKAEVVGVKRGSYENIIFDRNTKRYFFNGVCPFDGSEWVNPINKKFNDPNQKPQQRSTEGQLFNDSLKQAIKNPETNNDDLPF